MPTSPLPKRRRIRLPKYDYSQPGYYFVTICTHDRQLLLGQLIGGEMRLSQCGEVVVSQWGKLTDHYPNVSTDAFVVMPNHVHGVIVLTDARADLGSAPTDRHPLSEVVRSFKAFSTREINVLKVGIETPVWQRSYHKRVVRSERELEAVREYIMFNPEHWDMDPENIL